MNAVEDRDPPLPRNVKALGWASLLNDVASEMVYPLLPQFLIQVLGGNKLYLGLIEGAADTAASLLKLGSGGWSDRLGSRKGFVVFGYALACLVRPLLAVIRVPWQLFAIRIGDRIGKGLRTSPRDAMIADSTTPEMRGRAFGFHRAMDHLGAALGPMLAAAFLWCWPGQLRWLFLLTLMPGLVIVPLLLFALREAPLDARESVGGTWTLAPFDRRFRIYLVAVLVFSLSNSSDAFLLLRAGELGVATPLLPLLWCVFHIVKSAGNSLAGRSVNRFGPRAMILVGWCLYAAIYALFGLATAAWHAWALFVGYAFFFALTEPAEKTLVASLVASQHRGLAYGWFHFAIGLATLPSSLLFGALYQQYGVLAAFGCGAALAVAAAGILLTVSLPPTPDVENRGA